MFEANCSNRRVSGKNQSGQMFEANCSKQTGQQEESEWQKSGAGGKSVSKDMCWVWSASSARKMLRTANEQTVLLTPCNQLTAMLACVDDERLSAWFSCLGLTWEHRTTTARLKGRSFFSVTLQCNTVLGFGVDPFFKWQGDKRTVHVTSKRCEECEWVMRASVRLGLLYLVWLGPDFGLAELKMVKCFLYS